MTRQFLTALTCLAMVVATSGCGPQLDPEVARQREMFLLDQEPAGAVGIVDAKSDLSDDQQELILVAKVGAGEHETWENGKAVFAVSEIVEDAPNHGGDGHDPSTCPFCKRRQSLVNTRAIVRIVDGAGQIVERDARELLGIQLNQTVVVKGRGEVDALGNLIVSASGIFLK